MSPAPPARQTRSDARERILLTACKLFYRDGVRATGIDRVIASAAVTKVTFYRHFPSKNALVQAFLEYENIRWLNWFNAALQRHVATGAFGLDALLPTLREWFAGGNFRGCAFINTLVELGDAVPAVVDIARRHKRAMTAAISRLLPPSRHRRRDAQAIAVAVDGAIIHAQLDTTPAAALQALARLLRGVQLGG
jgi:AcrR family transcriptional regulator